MKTWKGAILDFFRDRQAKHGLRRLERLERQVRFLERCVMATRPSYKDLASSDSPPLPFGLHSQHAEDGILMGLFEQIGAPRRKFVEIGIQDGLECQAAFWAFAFGWGGLLVDGDPKAVREAKRNYREYLQVAIRQAFVTREAVNDILKEGGADPEPDLFSLDIDGNEYWVWDAMEAIRPRVAVLEYNRFLGPDKALTIPYDPSFVHRSRHPRGYVGASLAALAKLGVRKGMALVAAEAGNAIFVRQECLKPGLTPVTPTQVFVPPARDARTERIQRGVRGLPWQEV
jgi:hypothetical protein